MAASFVAKNCDIAFTGVSGNTATGTTTRTIQAGEHVVVALGNRFNASNGVATGVTVGGLALSVDKASNAQNPCEIWSAHTGLQIGSGATVTISWTTTAANERAGICFSLSGVASSSYVRGTPASASNSASANPSVASDSTPQAGDIAIAAVFAAVQNGATAGAGYTLIANLTEIAVSSTLAAEYDALGSGGDLPAEAPGVTERDDTQPLRERSEVEKLRYALAHVARLADRDDPRLIAHTLGLAATLGLWPGPKP